MIRVVASTLFALCAAVAAQPQWPQFRGPGGAGVAVPSDPPVRFGPETGVVWKVALPSGHSSPCIWGDRIFLTAYDGTKLETLCLRRSDGTVLWRQVAPGESIEPTHRIGSPASPTAATDGERVFVYFGSFGLLAYDFDGKEQWRIPLPQPVVEFGASASPVIADGRVFLVCDQDEGSFMLAVDARSGRTLWRKERPEFRRSFATPFIWRHDGAEELIVPGSIWLKSYNPSDGGELWTFSGTSRVANSSAVAGDGLLFSASWNVGGDADSRVTMEPFEDFMRGIGKPADALLARDDMPASPVRDRYSQIDLDKNGKVTREEWEGMRSMFARAGNAALALRPGGRDEISATHLAWKSTRSLPYVASPLYFDGRLYTIKNGGLASCYRAKTGEPLYQDHRLDAPGDYYASPIAGGGRIYLASQNGVMLVLAAGDAPTVLARAEFGEKIMATPAIVGDTLYVRTAGHLYALREAR
ncbi:MAG: PQQ-binding-like beta-propeller repeat protein [Chthoniobacteraceae bacterium]